MENKDRRAKISAIEFPNGRDKRNIAFGERLGEQLLEIPFERFRMLGDYQAINNQDESYIEAHIRQTISPRSSRVPLVKIPGVKIIRNSGYPSSEVAEDAAEGVGEIIENSSVPYDLRAGYQNNDIRYDIRVGDRWRLRISDASRSWRVEISEASAAGSVLIDDISRSFHIGPFPPTLKIFGPPVPQPMTRHCDSWRTFREPCCSS